MTKEALKLALEALNSGVDAQVGRVVWTEYDSCLIVDAIIAIKEALAQPGQSATDIAALIQGMEVSIDVSTGDHDAGHRLFGTVTLVQENQGGKHGLILLVQDPEPNFKAQPEQEPVAHSVIAGALFDFMGWLTSRKERIVLSSADNASPAVDGIRDFANMRGLSLDDAKVLDWNTTPPQRPWVGLTAQEAADCWTTSATQTWHNFEAALKKKNT